MALLRVEKESIVPIADNVRTMENISKALTLEEISSSLSGANNEINEQTNLINQIVTALEGKASGSGGINLPTLTSPASASDVRSGKEIIDSTGNVVTGTVVTKTANDVTVNGANVTIPTGIYDSVVTKSVSTATQATPSVSIDTNGKITATSTQTAGYVSAGTKTGTKQLTTKAATTITPSTISQTAVAKNVYTTGTITVAAIPSNYEDVTEETNAYTAKIASLESAITALETELEGKASGGSLSSVSVTNYSGSVNTFMYIDAAGQQAFAAPGATVELGSRTIYVMTGYDYTFVAGTSLGAALSLGPAYYGITIASDTASIHIFSQGGASGGGGN